MTRTLIPLFIFNPDQIEPKLNPFFGHKSVQFMCDSLEELDEALQKRGSRLFYLYGRPADTLPLLQEMGVQAIFENEDITPFAVRRKQQLGELLAAAGLHYECQLQDYSLLPSECYIPDKGSYYKSFTDYYRSVGKKEVRAPEPNPYSNFISGQVKFKGEWQGFLSDLYTPHPEIARGGRKAAFTLLQKLHQQKDYAKRRNFPATPTTKIAPYLKFGCLSVREFYAITSKTFSKEHDLVRQLYWRDFFYHLTFHFPHVEIGSFYPVYDQVKWADWEEGFERWKAGTTGCPLVDAGMRQLAREGWLPNVLRLLTANFLVKNLFIDWRLGERYYAHALVDYDWGINNGSWQFVSGSGKVQQPYYLVINCFNSQPFDSSCEYIKQWVPELADVPP